MTEDVKVYHFVSNRNITIGGLNGRRLAFAKGVPTHVPRNMHTLVMEKGVLPCDASGKSLDEPETVAVDPEARTVLLAPEVAEDREVAIEKVIEAIVAKNDAKDFAGGGTPHAGAVSAALGWRADQREVRTVWLKVRGKILKPDGVED